MKWIEIEFEMKMCKMMIFFRVSVPLLAFEFVAFYWEHFLRIMKLLLEIPRLIWDRRVQTKAVHESKAIMKDKRVQDTFTVTNLNNFFPLVVFENLFSDLPSLLSAIHRNKRIIFWDY